MMRDTIRLFAHQKIFYLLIFLLPTQLGYHFWPFWSIILGRRVDYLSPTLFFTDILVLFIFASWTIQNIKSLKLSFLQFYSAERLTLMVSILWIIISTLFSLQPSATIYGWVKVLEWGFLFLYIKRTNPSTKSMFISLSLSILLFSCLGLIQVIHQGTIGGIVWFLGERTFTINTPNIAKEVLCFPHSYSCLSWLRPYATFPHPNVFAGFLGFYIVFFLTKFHGSIKNMSLLMKFFSFFPVAIASLGLLISFSRTAWIGVMAAITLWITPEKYKKNFFFVLLVCITLIFVVSLLSPLPYFNDESIDVRLSLNQSAIKILHQYPLLGVGLNNFLFALPSFITTRTVYFLQPVHNIYLLVVSEFGVIGTLLLIGLVAYTFRKTSWSLRTQSLPWVIFLLVIGMFDHYFLTVQQGQLLLVLALSLFSSQNYES